MKTKADRQLKRVKLLCCCCSHINSHNQVRGHRTGSSQSGAEEYPREKHSQPKVVHAYKVPLREVDTCLPGATQVE